MSIKNKIITVVLCVTFIAVSVGFTFIAKWDTNRVRKNIQESLVVNTKLIGDYCVVPLYFGDRQQATEALLRLKFIESVESGYLFNEKGELFATYPDSLQDNNIPEVTQIENSMLKDGFFYISEPISYKNKVLGIIYVRANSKMLESQKKILFTIISMLLITLVVISYLLAASMQKMISQPILDLAKLTASISRNQDFTVQVKSPRRDEVGILYRQFNHLLAQLLKKQNERDEAEKKLKDSEAEFRYLFEQNPAILLIYELGSLQIIAVNESFIRHYGYTQKEILSMKLTDLYPMKEREPITDLTGRLIGLNYVGEWHHLKKDGTIITIEVNSHGITYEGRHARIAVIKDITANKQVELEIKNLNANLEKKVKERTVLLESANKELEAFSYSVSHDLRAPLRHINGYLDLLKNRNYEQLDEKGKHYIQSVLEASNQMGALIDDLLDFSRNGRLEMKPDNIDMNRVVKEAMTFLVNEIKGRKIEWVIDPLPEIYGDYAMIKQVWVNLLSNAIKYSRKRDIAIIEIGSLVNEEENIFFIRDNGAGFDMQYAQKLFGVFQRLHSSGEFEGTGIGLANVRQTIKRHHGRTWAEGEVDKGATFYFSIPKKIKTMDHD